MASPNIPCPAGPEVAEGVLAGVFNLVAGGVSIGVVVELPDLSKLLPNAVEGREPNRSVESVARGGSAPMRR